MSRPAAIEPQLHQLRMPDREDQVVTARGGRSGQHGVCIHTREALVNQVLVGVAGAEGARVIGAGVPVPRFDKDEIRGGNVLFARRSVEIAVKERARPVISDGMKMATLEVNRDRPIGWKYGRRCRAFASTAVVEETKRHSRRITS